MSGQPSSVKKFADDRILTDGRQALLSLIVRASIGPNIDRNPGNGLSS